MMLATPELVLRSLDATWTYARWETLPEDGNRYEVIDGVLYMTTAPSFFHQTKRDAYARADVPEYWVVRPETRDMLIFWEPDVDAGAYIQERYVAFDALLESPTLPIRLTVAALFAGAPDTTL